MGNKEKELEVEIKGYGCDDDCEQYFEKTASKDCGWKETDNTCHWCRKYQVNM